jgi:hypothetical protein
LARRYGQRPGAAGELASLWSELPPAKQRLIVAQIRVALLEVKAATVEAVPLDDNHAAMTVTHTHSHAAYGFQVDGGGQHQHQHQHDNDADHDHSHADLDAAVRSAEQAKRQQPESSCHRKMVVIHRHPHPDGTGNTHTHEHQHTGPDARHASHSHVGPYAPEKPGGQSGRARMMILASARRQREAAAWEALASTARQARQKGYR